MCFRTGSNLKNPPSFHGGLAHFCCTFKDVCLCLAIVSGYISNLTALIWIAFSALMGLVEPLFVHFSRKNVHTVKGSVILCSNPERRVS